MIEKLEKLLLKDYDYELGNHKVCFEEIKKSKIIIPAIILFLLVLILFFVIEFVDIIVLGFAFFVLVLIPVVLKKGERYDIVVITSDMLIQQTIKSEVIAIKFDDIKKFGTDKTGVVIKDTKNSISLDPAVLANDILIIIEILEAKGKTFDKTKDYMIRPIEVVIKGDEVTIVDIEQEVSSTEKLVAQFYKEYAMLTPGFIKDIILMNSVIEEAQIKDKNLLLNISSFEVNPGHPENTKFEAQIANDCIMIFENVKISSITKREARGSEDEIIESSLDNLVEEIENGIISDWKYRKNSIDLQFSVGLFIVRTTFKFKEVIIGWNEFN